MHSSLAACALQITERDGRPAWAVFFADWAPTSGSRAREQECLYLVNKHLLKRQGVWRTADGYWAVKLGTRPRVTDSQPESESANSQGRQQHQPVTSYLHRMVCWGKHGGPDFFDECTRKEAADDDLAVVVDHKCSHKHCLAATCLWWVSRDRNLELGRERAEEAAEARQDAREEARRRRALAAFRAR